MQAVHTISGTAYPFGRKNVDTDVIIPSHWLKTISRDGLGQGCFESLRKEPGNVFEDPAYKGAVAERDAGREFEEIGRARLLPSVV